MQKQGKRTERISAKSVCQTKKRLRYFSSTQSNKFWDKQNYLTEGFFAFRKKRNSGFKAIENWWSSCENGWNWNVKGYWCVGEMYTVIFVPFFFSCKKHGLEILRKPFFLRLGQIGTEQKTFL